MDILSLCADFFVLGGSVLQVGGKFWIRHLSHSRKLQMPAGGIGVNVRGSNDNHDIFSFLSIGVGSIYFIYNDYGLSSTSLLLLALCLTEAILIAGIGFETYSVFAENSYDVLNWQVWPLHTIPFIMLALGDTAMVIAVAMTVAFGWLDAFGALPLLVVSIASSAYLWKSLNFKTLRHKDKPSNEWMRQTGSGDHEAFECPP